MKKAIIIGAGPAGLTAAYELLKRTDITPIVLEKSGDIGGISRTIQYKGNRMDMGPHRFFSKSDRVMNWWLNIMPLEEKGEQELTISYQNKSRQLNTSSPASTNASDKRMLVIQRLTRIYFLRKFFAYPIQLSIDTLRTLGLIRTIKILFSFIWARAFPKRPAKSLEDFIINQFGRQLYLLFFKDYTEKVWGVPCQDISAEWGAQRIKGVSLGKAIAQAVKNLRKNKANAADLGQKETETSLIEQFLYPKYGPGSLWEEVARQVQEMGGKIYLHQDVQHIYSTQQGICSIHAIDSQTGEMQLFDGDYFFSSMPVQELVAGLGDKVPVNVREVAQGLQYRDFINVGILLKQLSAPGEKDGEYTRLDLKDNWIYIQERDVKVGRLMIYNNWGGGMIKDPDTVWIGMEYFCNKHDELWVQDDEAIQALAIKELEQMGLARVEDILDSTVRRMEKTYPAYFGTYDRFAEIREWTDRYENLFLIGRNGMHKYNNADHSMLTAMVAVDNIAAGITSKENVWAVNTEQEYHEEKAAMEPAGESRGSRYKIPSLAGYLWGQKWNRAYTFVALAAFVIQFIFFKTRYPFANYMPDSYSYLEAAANNADVNMWPIAYSKFLRLISVFTHSDKILTGLQYFFMQTCTLVFFFTLLRLLQPGRLVRNALGIFILFNPIPLYVSNYVSADALFIGFSLLWMSSLLWIIYQPRPRMILVQATLLLACFTLRYNAIYYPVIAALAFILSRQRWTWKVGGIALGAVFVLLSITYTSGRMKELTGKRQFSAFGGWQLANNALYMYEHIPASQRVPAPARLAKLETMVRQHMDTLSKVKLSEKDSINSYFYLWSGRAPLSKYLTQEYKKDSTTPYFKRWASEGPLYLEYATWLIRQYPIAFAKYFIFPNTIKLAVPPTEFLGQYNMGADSVDGLAKAWFHYSSLKIKEKAKQDSSVKVIGWYSIFSALVNLLLLIHIVGIFALGRWKAAHTLQKFILLAVCFWLVNSSFSVFASPIVLRYQVFPLLLTLSVALLAGEAIYRTESLSKTKEII